jgi:hypothetical protein
LNSQNNKEGSRGLKDAIIGGIIAGVFAVVAACVGGIFLIVNTLVDKDRIVVIPTSQSQVEPSTLITPTTSVYIQPESPSTPFASEILPEGVNSASEMPNWLAANVGGTPNQWQRVQNGKWRFRAGNSGGVGDNQILSPKAGYLVFGADSGQKDSNGGVIWKDVSIGPGESTFWRCGDSNKPGTIDTAEWTLFNPNIGTSCN